jgi:hypothetical protein
MNTINSRVIGREHNIVRVDFRHEPDPPAPKFPGAGAVKSAPFEDVLVLNINRTEAA